MISAEPATTVDRALAPLLTAPSLLEFAYPFRYTSVLDVIAREIIGTCPASQTGLVISLDHHGVVDAIGLPEARRLVASFATHRQAGIATYLICTSYSPANSWRRPETKAFWDSLVRFTGARAVLTHTAGKARVFNSKLVFLTALLEALYSGCTTDWKLVHFDDSEAVLEDIRSASSGEIEARDFNGFRRPPRPLESLVVEEIRRLYSASSSSRKKGCIPNKCSVRRHLPPTPVTGIGTCLPATLAHITSTSSCNHGIL